MNGPVMEQSQQLNASLQTGQCHAGETYAFV